MSNSPKVVAFNDGSVVKVNARKPNKSYFRVKSTEMTFSGGHTNFSNRYATVSVDTANVEDMDLFAGKAMQGRIVATESLTPFYEGDEPKRAGSDEDAPLCLAEGEKIYRSSTLESADKADTLIAHTNVEEIQAYAKAKQSVSDDSVEF